MIFKGKGEDLYTQKTTVYVEVMDMARETSGCNTYCFQLADEEEEFFRECVENSLLREARRDQRSGES